MRHEMIVNGMSWSGHSYRIFSKILIKYAEKEGVDSEIDALLETTDSVERKTKLSELYQKRDEIDDQMEELSHLNCIK